ncbi:hypothetical protein GE061_016824 [Apolygus lucorum]|uniref:Uncharacterized protein n=1 Tax=Apolygus lucorum TaxID=248454 RepID=A0A6A4JSA4_APOLU|nr:hypothetical protein GE061_016824 [Apolygus lucorum]
MFRVFSRSHKNADQLVRTITKQRFYCNKSVEPATKTSSTVSEEQNHSVHRRMYSVTNFDKKVLVWVGRYKTTDEIPPTVPVETIERARNKGRIKFCNYMIVGTIVGCIFMAWSGKQAAKRGESLHQMNLDWHKAVKEGKA